MHGSQIKDQPQLCMAASAAHMSGNSSVKTGTMVLTHKQLSIGIEGLIDLVIIGSSLAPVAVQHTTTAWDSFYNRADWPSKAGAGAFSACYGQQLQLQRVAWGKPCSASTGKFDVHADSNLTC